MQHFKTINDFHRTNGFPLPENPMVSLLRCDPSKACSVFSEAFTGDFYIIGFKKLKSGVILYGRTKYDHDNGSMYFIKPRQVFQLKDIELEEDGFLMLMHEDFLNGHALHSEIKKYNYFEYEAHEALHLTPKEELIIWELYHKIDTECKNNPDEYSRDIILTHIDSILKYSQRFYKRQFIHRTELSGTVVTRFNEALAAYFEDGSLENKGLPTVKEMASQLNLSARYLSDLLKQETGKTAIDLIHIFLISEAKNLLVAADNNVAEIAYTLGFENPPYFSRLFKKEVGVSPNQYKRMNLN
jgi:AraC family transcriptional activator of pobA